MLSLNSKHEEFLSIDGELLIPEQRSDRIQIQLLPGLHTVGGVQPYNCETAVPSVQFSAAAGKAYLLAFSSVRSDSFYIVRVYEGIPDSDKVTRLVSSPSPAGDTATPVAMPAGCVRFLREP